MRRDETKQAERREQMSEMRQKVGQISGKRREGK